MWLVVLDVLVGVVSRYPAGGPAARPTALQRYFDYGRSIEGRAARMVGPTDETSAPLAVAGWLEPTVWQPRWAHASDPSDLTVAMYGSSFAMDVGEELDAMDSDLRVRFAGGPGAPISHSYAAYGLDRRQYDAPIVVLGILASAVPGLETVTGLTWLFDSPCPYTYPRFTLTPTGLEAWWPSIRSLADFRAALHNEPVRDAFVAELRAHDRYYDAFAFDAGWLDDSTVVRLLRRAWAAHRFKRLGAAIHGPSGFNESSPTVALARALVVEFVAAVREDGRTPVVLLLHDQGYGDDLFRLLAPTLDAVHVPYVSTHEICPAADGSNFASDGHFTREASRRIAVELLGTVRSLAEAPAPATTWNAAPLASLPARRMPLVRPR
jgi:hypothetical protein